MYLVNSYRHKSAGKEEGTEAQYKEKKAKEDEEEEEQKGGISRDPKEGVKGPAAEMFDVSKLHVLSSIIIDTAQAYLPCTCSVAMIEPVDNGEAVLDLDGLYEL